MKTPQQLLQQTLEVGECLLPDASPGGRTPYPTVFVHGLLGWGARDALYRAVPYWGLAAGDVLGYLNACGYDCRAASVGIISSAWDRACELYAELTGGTADYELILYDEAAGKYSAALAAARPTKTRVDVSCDAV